MATVSRDVSEALSNDSSEMIHCTEDSVPTALGQTSSDRATFPKNFQFLVTTVLGRVATITFVVTTYPWGVGGTLQIIISDH